MDNEEHQRLLRFGPTEGGNLSNIRVFRWPSEKPSPPPVCKMCGGVKLLNMPRVVRHEITMHHVLGSMSPVITQSPVGESYRVHCPICTPERAGEEYFECDTCQDTGECMGSALYPSGHTEITVHCPDCSPPNMRGRRADPY